MLMLGSNCLDEAHAGGEDGAWSRGAGTRRCEYNGIRGEHSDRQPVRPAGEDLESRPTGQTGNLQPMYDMWAGGAGVPMIYPTSPKQLISGDFRSVFQSRDLYRFEAASADHPSFAI